MQGAEEATVVLGLARLLLRPARRYRHLIRLARADPVHAYDRQDEDLPIPHIAGARRVENRAHRWLDEVVRHADLESHLVLQLHLHGRAAVRLDPFGLATMPLHAGHGQPPDLRHEQRLEHLVRALGPNDRDDQLHAATSSGTRIDSSVDRVAVAVIAGITRTAPSPRVYASSPCCVMSRPTASSRCLLRTRATAFT